VPQHHKDPSSLIAKEKLLPADTDAHLEEFDKVNVPYLLVF